MAIDSKRTLQHTFSRRRLLPALIRELFVAAGTLRGGKGLSLTDLADLPREQLALIMPRINPEFELSVVDGHVWSQHLRTGRWRQHFTVDPTSTYVFNQFDGVHTLGEVSFGLASSMQWEEDVAFACVADLFLSLVRYYVVLPANSLE